MGSVELRFVCLGGLVLRDARLWLRTVRLKEHGKKPDSDRNREDAKTSQEFLSRRV